MGCYSSKGIIPSCRADPAQEMISKDSKKIVQDMWFELKPDVKNFGIQIFIRLAEILTFNCLYSFIRGSGPYERKTFLLLSWFHLLKQLSKDMQSASTVVIQNTWRLNCMFSLKACGWYNHDCHCISLCTVLMIEQLSIIQILSAIWAYI